MSNNAAITTAMVGALNAISREGRVFAGRNVYKGRGFMVAASTLIALERRGKVVLSISPDGGMIARKP